MSVRIMSLVWDYEALGQSETLVLLAIADHADDRGHCWPSIDRIAAKSRLKRRQTQTVIKRLELSGYLQVDRPAAKLGRGHTSRYTVINKGAISAPILEEGCKNQHVRVQFSAKKGAVAIAPESSLTIKESSEDALQRSEDQRRRLREEVSKLKLNFKR